MPITESHGIAVARIWPNLYGSGVRTVSWYRTGVELTCVLYLYHCAGGNPRSREAHHNLGIWFTGHLKVPTVLSLLTVAKASQGEKGKRYHRWLWEQLQGGLGLSLLTIGSPAEAKALSALCLMEARPYTGRRPPLPLLPPSPLSPRSAPQQSRRMGGTGHISPFPLAFVSIS